MAEETGWAWAFDPLSVIPDCGPLVGNLLRSYDAEALPELAEVLLYFGFDYARRVCAIAVLILWKFYQKMGHAILLP